MRLSAALIFAPLAIATPVITVKVGSVAGASLGAIFRPQVLAVRPPGIDCANKSAVVVPAKAAVASTQKQTSFVMWTATPVAGPENVFEILTGVISHAGGRVEDNLTSSNALQYGDPVPLSPCS
jgi:hypothetical protein